MARHAIHAGGTALEFITEGEGQALLVAGSSVYYPRTFSGTLKASCEIICADLPHFVPPGPDFTPESVSFDFYAECIDAVRAAAGRERVVVAGHSHHGNVALEYARRYPGHVSHVVMTGSPPVDIARTVQGARQYWEAHASEERRRVLRERRDSVDREYLASLAPEAAFVHQYVTDAPLYWHDPRYDAAWLWEDMRFSMDVVRAFRDLYQAYDIRHHPLPPEIPLLVVMGESDYAVPHTLWEDVLPDLGNVTFRLLENAGHTPQLENAPAFDRALLDWLRDEDRSTPDG